MHLFCHPSGRNQLVRTQSRPCHFLIAEVILFRFHEVCSPTSAFQLGMIFVKHFDWLVLTPPRKVNPTQPSAGMFVNRLPSTIFGNSEVKKMVRPVSLTIVAPSKGIVFFFLTCIVLDSGGVARVRIFILLVEAMFFERKECV